MGLSFTDPKTLPFEERMKRKDGWFENESISNIAKACHPDDKKEMNRLINDIVGYCKSGDLACYGDIRGWEWRISQLGWTPNPYPEVDGHYVNDKNNPLLSAYEGKYRAAPADCLIHRDEFKRFLISVEKWPATGFLANWWPDIELQDDGSHLDEDIYKQRRKSFECWLTSQDVDTTSRDETVRKPAIKTVLDGFDTVPDIYKALKEARQGDMNTNMKGKGKGKSLWESQGTFNRSFWQQYCDEIGYSR